MKKSVILLFVITIITILLMPVAWADGVSLPEYVNIGLKYGDGAVTSLRLTGSGFTATDEYGTLLFEDGSLSYVDVTYSGGIVSVSSGGAYLLSYDGTVIIAPVMGNVTFNGCDYRGSMKIVPTGGGLSVINHLLLEDYLCGVVPREIGGKAPLEAQKAQAVCARSYTARFIGKHASDGFDICTNVHCQVYGGASCETESANRAVQETMGIVAEYDGKIAELYYFASDGGATEDVENVWGSTEHPYLKGVDDPYETDKATHHTWSVTFTKNELNELFSQYELGDISDIEVNKTSDRGTVTEMVVTGTKGEKIFTKSQCRSAFGGKTYSQAFTVTKNYEQGALLPTVISALKKMTLPSVVYVMGADGVVEKRVQDLSILSAKGISRFSIEGDVTSFTINGRGYGHLIGMSQWGAMAMADEGFTYEDILNHYYTGITLSFGYETDEMEGIEE